MGKPDILPNKPNLFCPSKRSLAIAFHHDGVFPLSEVGMKPQTMLACKCQRLLKGFLVAVDWLTGGNHNLAHAVGVWIMIGFHQAFTIK